MKGNKSNRQRSRPSDGKPAAQTGQQKGRLSTDLKPNRANRIEWTEPDDQKLFSIVQERVAANSYAKVYWRGVAALMGGNRNGKQCREKYHNDLRPEITKGPWSLQEDYVLALAHSALGSKWSDMEAFLPHRGENTIKNHWNGVVRHEADSRTTTFLELYAIELTNVEPKQLKDLSGKLQLHREKFESARNKWDEMAANSELPPLSEFTVERDHFTHGKGAKEMGLLQVAEMIAAPALSASSRKKTIKALATVIGVPRAAGPSRIHTSHTSQESDGPPGMGIAMHVPFMSPGLPGLPGMPFLPIMSRLHSSEAGAPLPSHHPASSHSHSAAKTASIQGAAQQLPPTPANMVLFNGGQLPGLPSMTELSFPTRSFMSGPGRVWPVLAGSAAPINMHHDASGLQYTPGMGMDGSGWSGAGLGAAGMGMGTLGRASDLGDASCQVFQLEGVDSRPMGMPGTGMEQLEGLGELSIMARRAAKPAVPPRTLSLGRTSRSGAKHLPMALTFQPGNLPTGHGCGSAPLPIPRVHAGRTDPAPVTPFALVNPDLAHLRPPGGGYFSHSQPPPPGSMHSHSHQAKLGLHPASSLGAVQDHHLRSVYHPPASFPEGVDELVRELGVDEAWLHEPPCDAAESPCKGARPAGTGKLPTVRETAASCMAGEGASRACFESPLASPTTRSLLAPDCDLGTDIWDLPAPHSTARTGMRPAGLSSRFAATGAPPFPLSELLDDAGAEHSSLRFCGGLMSPTAIHDLSVHGAVVQVQVSRAPAKPVKHESSAMDMMATPSNCGPPPSLWGLTAPGREAVPLAAPNTLQHYWASHYPFIHHRTGNSSAQPGLENALFGQAGRLPLLLDSTRRTATWA